MPLDVVVVRKVGAPQQPELGIGAVAEGGVEVVARQRACDCGVDGERFAQLATAERARVDERVARYREGRPRFTLPAAT